MPLSIFYSQKQKSSWLTGAANVFIALSLVVNFSFPHLSLAQTTLSSPSAHSLPNPPFVYYFKNPYSPKPAPSQPQIKYSFYVLVTAYSSTVSQCDSTPFITANGTRVYDGVVAANFLPFGTKLRLPQYSGGKIYTVEDRMHPRFSRRIDIWMPTNQAAKQFGVKWLKVEVLE